MTMTGATAAVIAASMEFAPSRVLAQSKITPDAALQDLIDGNRRFMSGRLASFDEDLAILKQHTVEKQEPFAAVLSCADSRVPVELIFDQSIGHIFATRVAGNVVTSEIIASLEYGAAALGTKAIVVMGHAGCGAVKANAKIQAALLRKSSTVISALVQEGKLKVVAAHYDLTTGNVTLLD
jgi:carbonic anhydrase